MAKTVIALYDDVDHAQKVVRDLVDTGIDRDHISLMSNNQAGSFGDSPQETIMPDPSSATAEGVGVGAGIGAALGGIGGLLVGLGALVIPGIGPVIAAGPLAAALGGVAGAGAGAVAGGAAGGVIGALGDMGVSQEQAGYYAEGVRRGGTLVTVRTDDSMAPRAVDIMNRYEPTDVKLRASEWRASGWAGFNPTKETRTFDTYETGFQSHFNEVFANRGYTYNQYAPAYRFGYDRANAEQNENREWNDVELDMRLDWESRYPDSPWEEFKEAVHHSWNEVKAKIR